MAYIRKAERRATELLQRIRGESPVMQWRITLFMLLEQMKNLDPDIKDVAHRKFCEFLVASGRDQSWR